MFTFSAVLYRNHKRWFLGSDWRSNRSRLEGERKGFKRQDHVCDVSLSNIGCAINVGHNMFFWIQHCDNSWSLHVKTHLSTWLYNICCNIGLSCILPTSILIPMEDSFLWKKKLNKFENSEWNGWVELCVISFGREHFFNPIFLILIHHCKSAFFWT